MYHARKRLYTKWTTAFVFNPLKNDKILLLKLYEISNLVWRPRKVYFNGKRKFLFYFAFLTSYSHLSWFFKFKLMYRYTFVHCDKYWYSFKWLKRMLRYMLKCHLSANDIKIYRLRLLSFGSVILKLMQLCLLRRYVHS